MVRQTQFWPYLVLVVFGDHTIDDPGTCVRVAGRIRKGLRHFIEL